WVKMNINIQRITHFINLTSQIHPQILFMIKQPLSGRLFMIKSEVLTLPVFSIQLLLAKRRMYG
ncbi:MAG: hypothetical protein WBB37_00315, partial [bacterium]